MTKVILMAERKINDFEKNLQQLETLVEKLEDGNLSLDKSLQLFEQGTKLIKQCQKTLTQAEQKIQKLTESDNGPLLADFEEDE